MRFRILIAIAFSFLLANCSTGPDFERDNENDPGGNHFKPNQPYGQNYYIDGNNLVLTWKSNSEFANSYIIEKKIHDTKITTVLDTVSKTTKYIDDSGIFGYPTEYYIYAFDGEFKSDTTLVKPEIGVLDNLSYSTNKNVLTISWTPSLFNAQKLKVHRISETENEAEVSFFLDMKNRNSIEIPIEENLSGTGLNHTFTFSPVYENEFGSSTGPVSYLKNVFPTCPVNVQSKLINESTLELTWSCYSTNFDNLNLNVTNEGITTVLTEISENTNEFIFNKEMKYLDEYLFSFENHLIKVENDILIDGPMPNIKNFSINEDKLQITVERDSIEGLTYQVLQRYRGYEFETIGNINPSENTIYLDLPEEFIPRCVNRECQRDIWFEYQLKSDVTPYSEIKSLIKGYNIVEKTTNSFILSKYEFSKNNYSAGMFSDEIFAYNTTDNKTIILDTESSSIKHSLSNDKYYPFIKLSYRNDIILLSDLDNQTILKTIQDDEIISQTNHNDIGTLNDAAFWRNNNTIILSSSTGLYIWDVEANIITLVDSAESLNGLGILTLNTEYSDGNSDGILSVVDGNIVKVYRHNDGLFTDFFEFNNSIDSPIIDMIYLYEVISYPGSFSKRSLYLLHENGMISVNGPFKYGNANSPYVSTSGNILSLNQLNGSYLFYFDNLNESASFISTLSNPGVYKKVHRSYQLNHKHFYDLVAPRVPSTIFGISYDESTSEFVLNFYKPKIEWSTTNFSIEDY